MKNLFLLILAFMLLLSPLFALESKDLKDNGISLDVQYTATMQGANDSDFPYKYGGKADIFASVDFLHLSGYDLGGLSTHIEYRHAESNSFLGNILLPPNTATILPLTSPDEVIATSVYYTHALSSNIYLLIGKFNVVDFLKNDKFFGGWGNERFMNVAFVAPPSGLLPPVIIGTIVKYRQDTLNYTFMLFDPHDRTNDYIPDNLFSDGVNISLSASTESRIFSRETKLTLGGIYSTKTGANLSAIMRPDLEVGDKKGSYNLNFTFAHSLLQDSEKRDIGVYGKINICDGNPNLIKSAFSGGLSIYGLLSTKDNDNLGIGYFYYDWSDVMQEAISEAKDIDNEHGVELFYRYSFSKYLNLSVDIQYVDPAFGAYKNTFISGFRINIHI